MITVCREELRHMYKYKYVFEKIIVQETSE